MSSVWQKTCSKYSVESLPQYSKCFSENVLWNYARVVCTAISGYNASLPLAAAVRIPRLVSESANQEDLSIRDDQCQDLSARCLTIMSIR